MDTSTRSYRKFAIRARVGSFRHAVRGLIQMTRTEHNAWVHAAGTVAAILASVALRISLQDWRWIVLAIAIVWIAEALNTAVERICDLVSPSYNEHVGQAKDVAAGAVLVSAAAAALIGAMTLIPYIVP